MMEFRSQHKQDYILDKIIFAHKKDGVFLDIGANDGITYSNTYVFEKYLGWSGICIEPLPAAFRKLQINRTCLMEQCAVGANNQTEIFLEITGYAEMLSGLMKNYDKRHLDRIDSEIKMYGGEKKKIELKTVNINELLTKHSIFRIDYCNIDTEGSELEILKAIDFKKINIDVITVEANYRIDKVKLKIFLFINGYSFVKNLGNDMLFLHKRIVKKLGGVKNLKKKIDLTL